MKKRYIQDRMRSDTWFTDLDPIEKLLRIYLLSNDKLWVCWIYELSLKKMWYDTWIDRDMIAKILVRFEKDKRCFYRDWFILVCNFFKNLQISSSSDNIRKWVERELKELWNHLTPFKEAIIEDTMKTLTRPLQDPYKELGILYLTLLNFTLLESPVALEITIPIGEWEKIDKVKQILSNLEELDRVNKKFPWIDIDWLELEVIKMLDWCKSPKWREIVNWKNFVENRFKDKKTWELIYKKIKVQLSDEDIRK